MADERTYVLIPGAGGVAWYWHLVVAELAARGRRAIAVDLPADDESAGLPEYVETVLRAVDDAAGPLVVVGMSMGGFTAPLVAARLASTVEIVLVNAMIPAPGETAGEWWSNTGSTAARSANDERLGHVDDGSFDEEYYFLHDVPAALVEEGANHQRNETDTIFGSVWPLAAWPALPTRVVAGRDDRMFPVEFQRRVARERLGVELDELPGGHLVALVHPDLLAAYLEAG